MFAVLGAEGRLGRLVAEALASQPVDPQSVVVLARRPDELHTAAKAGLRVAKGRYGDPTTMKREVAGCWRLLMLPAAPGAGTAKEADERRIEQHKQALAAVRTAGVEHVVYVSSLSPGSDNPSPDVAVDAETERAIRDLGCGWTLLRRAPSADALAAELVAARDGEGAWPSVLEEEDARVGWLADADLAAAAASVLAGFGYDGETFDLVGPASLTGAEVTGMLPFGPPADDAGAALPTKRQDDLADAAERGFLTKASGDLAALIGREPTPLARVLADAGLAAG